MEVVVHVVVGSAVGKHVMQGVEWEAVVAVVQHGRTWPRQPQAYPAAAPPVGGCTARQTRTGSTAGGAWSESACTGRQRCAWRGGSSTARCP
eukprot:1157865-Pelagomonas_calceolata.AAC.1